MKPRPITTFPPRKNSLKLVVSPKADKSVVTARSYQFLVTQMNVGSETAKKLLGI